MALVCGNTMVLKPSERNPGAVMFIMKLAQEAGIPDGCINVFHGTVERRFSLPFTQFTSCVCELIGKRGGGGGEEDPLPLPTPRASKLGQWC